MEAYEPAKVVSRSRSLVLSVCVPRLEQLHWSFPGLLPRPSTEEVPAKFRSLDIFDRIIRDVCRCSILQQDL